MFEKEPPPSSGRCKGKVLWGERRSVATRVSILRVKRGADYVKSIMESRVQAKGNCLAEGKCMGET